MASLFVLEAVLAGSFLLVLGVSFFTFLSTFFGAALTFFSGDFLLEDLLTAVSFELCFSFTFPVRITQLAIVFTRMRFICHLDATSKPVVLIICLSSLTLDLTWEFQ